MDDPVGPENNEWLLRSIREAERVVVAWGIHGSLHDREREVLELLPSEVFCLGTTKAGKPRHPLRLAASTPLRRIQ